MTGATRRDCLSRLQVLLGVCVCVCPIVTRRATTPPPPTTTTPGPKNWILRGVDCIKEGRTRHDQQKQWIVSQSAIGLQAHEHSMRQQRPTASPQNWPRGLSCLYTGISELSAPQLYFHHSSLLHHIILYHHKIASPRSHLVGWKTSTSPRTVRGWN